MGKVEHPRRTHSVYWRGSQYPYSTCHAAGGLAQQVRQRGPAYHTGGGNGIARLPSRPSGVDSLWAALSERVRTSNGARSLARSASSSSSGGNLGSPTGSLSSPGSLVAATITRMPEEDKPLKRLAFVRAQGSFWLTWMSHAYSTGRSLVPLPHGIIDALETTMSDISSNLVTAASEQSEKVLYSLDSKVDSVVSMASRACDTSDVWETLAQRPPFKFVLTAYQQAHDVVVATPIYTKALEIGGETMAKVHDSRLYKSLLPLVGPLTEPTVKRIIDSPTFQAVKEHLAPMPPAEECVQSV